MRLAFLNRRSENILIHPIVIPELELCHIQGHVFLADFVESADDATLEDRPKAFDGLGVYCANDILPGGVIDDGVWKFFVEAVVTPPLIGAEQADFGRDGLIHEGRQSGPLNVFDDARHNVALAADGASNWCLARSARSLTFAALIDVPVLCEAADPSLINFDDTGQLLEFFVGERGANSMTHIPSRLIGTEAHIPIDLKRAHALLAREHQVNDLEPHAQGLIGVFEDRPGKVREAVATLRSALIALPVPRLAVQLMRVLSAAARAEDAFWPSLTDKISAASVFIWEHRLELSRRKLMDWSLLLCARHGSPSLTVRRNIA
jgi:hypothetical protein